MMIVKPFNRVWAGYILLIAAVTAGLWLALRNAPGEMRWLVMMLLSAANLTLFPVYKFWLWEDPDFQFNIWGELPLQFCNVNLILCVLALALRSPTLYAYCFYMGVLSAVTALCFTIPEFVGRSILLKANIGYYVTHGLLVVISASFGTLGFFTPDYKWILPITIIVVLLSAAAHILNLILRRTVFPKANYFYTFGIDGNPVTTLLRRLIPVNYIFMLPMLLVLVAYCAAATALAKLLS